MTAFASDLAQAYVQRAATRDTVDFWMSVAIGATGAVGATTVDDPGFTITRTGVGTYNLAYPAGQRAFFDFMLQGADATPTAASFNVTALSPTAGTATIVATNGTAAAEIESGSTLHIKLTVASRA